LRCRRGSFPIWPRTLTSSSAQGSYSWAPR
jgi:hypothetical protein